MGGGGNITTISNTGMGEGVVGNGISFGTTGYATAPLSNDRWGGYFDYLNSVSGWQYVGGRAGGVDYAHYGGGAKLTGVKDNQGQMRGLACVEATEILFQDYGTGQLVNGRIHIELDPLFAQFVLIDETHPLKVFIQLEGDCKGVYVTNKTATGFDVVELGGGNSNVSFSWNVIANRANALDGQGNVSSAYADWRMPVMPDRVKSVQAQPAQVAAPQATPAPPGKPAGEAGQPR
jgi:hypothetical protein